LHCMSGNASDNTSEAMLAATRHQPANLILPTIKATRIATSTTGAAAATAESRRPHSFTTTDAASPPQSNPRTTTENDVLTFRYSSARVRYRSPGSSPSRTVSRRPPAGPEPYVLADSENLVRQGLWRQPSRFWLETSRFGQALLATRDRERTDLDG
jgi:hypothetical protein